MSWGLLHRTVFLELTRVFLMALVALTGLVLMAGLVAEATQHGLGPAQILAVIPLLLPSMLPYTLPTTTLFATCVIYGRLAADNEILALKAAGVHVGQIVLPALVLGVVTSAATFALYLDVIPMTHWMLRSQVLDLDDVLYTMLRKEGCIRHPKLNYTIFVKNVQGKRLLDAQFLRRDAKGEQYDVVAWAREAELRVDLNHKQILVHMKHCYLANNNGDVSAFFEEKIWPVDLPNDFFAAQVKSRATDMTWSELLESRDKFNDEKAHLDTEIGEHQAAVLLGGAPPHFPEHVQKLMNERRFRDHNLFNIDSELNMRPAFALGCLCFVLVGCPIGIWFSKSDYLSAFITCFLPIVVIYYPLMLCTINMAKSGRFDAWQGIWIADGLMMLTAGILFHRLART